MAGYSKGIVDTRKLNKDSKAKLGRRGDTKIREVDNRASHVNALEAYLIDVNGKAGEEYAKRVGAGTVNPLTGMPEYHDEDDHTNADHQTHQMETKTDNDGNTYQETNYNVPLYTQGEFTSNQALLGEAIGTYSPGEGQLDYDAYSKLGDIERAAYLEEFDITADKLKYISPLEQEPFDILEKQRDLSVGRLGEVRGFEERGLKSAYGATMGALGSQQAALGRSTGRGISQATQGAGQAMRKSNMAFSGTVAQGLQTQKKQLFQDYSAGTKDIKRERGTALDTLTLGKEGAGLDFRTAEYAEKQRQLDKLYADVAAIPS